MQFVINKRSINLFLIDNDREKLIDNDLSVREL